MTKSDKERPAVKGVYEFETASPQNVVTESLPPAPKLLFASSLLSLDEWNAFVLAACSTLLSNTPMNAPLLHQSARFPLFNHPCSLAGI